MPMNRSKNSRSTLLASALPAASASPTWATPSGVGSPRKCGQPLQKCRIRRPRQQRRQQRVFLRAGKIDLVDAVRRVVLVVKVGPQDGARDACHRLDRQHPLGGNARPIRHRGLGNADTARKLGDATGSANRFLQTPIRSCPFCFPARFVIVFLARTGSKCATSESIKKYRRKERRAIARGYKLE